MREQIRRPRRMPRPGEVRAGDDRAPAAVGRVHERRVARLAGLRASRVQHERRHEQAAQLHAAVGESREHALEGRQRDAVAYAPERRVRVSGAMQRPDDVDDCGACAPSCCRPHTAPRMPRLRGRMGRWTPARDVVAACHRVRRLFVGRGAARRGVVPCWAPGSSSAASSRSPSTRGGTTCSPRARPRPARLLVRDELAGRRMVRRARAVPIAGAIALILLKRPWSAAYFLTAEAVVGGRACRCSSTCSVARGPRTSSSISDFGSYPVRARRRTRRRSPTARCRSCSRGCGSLAVGRAGCC